MNETVRAKLMESERKGDYVFSDENGKRFTKLQHSFERALKKSGITDFRFHDLRHCFAVNLIMEGVDLNIIRN
jgi:site-specific recombinase XerD